MAVYIALLRGINVGGKNMIKMAELKKALMETGLNHVQTYIQSGNVLFISDKGEEALRKQIENTIEETFGFPVPVIIRTAEELRSIVANCPFSEEAVSEAEAASDAESLYVSLLLEPPSHEKVERLNPYNNEIEQFRIQGREIYLLFHQSVRNSKLVSHLQKLEVPSTVRNWKTMNKLVSLADALETHN